MTAELLCMGEPMLEFNQLPEQPDGQAVVPGRTWRRHLQRSRSPPPGKVRSVGYITALGRDFAGR